MTCRARRRRSGSSEAPRVSRSARVTSRRAGRPKNALEVLYDSYLEIYRPYMQDTRSFDTAHATPILEKQGLVCPVFDYEVFSRCMDYAVETDWGSKLLAR